MARKANRSLQYHSLPAEHVAAELGVETEHGLSGREAARRLQAQGPNELPRSRREHALKTLLRQFSDFMVVVLLAAAAVSLFLGELADGLMILLIVLLNGLLGFAQEYKAERALASLKELTQAEARVLRDGHMLVLPAAELVCGDLVLLEAGVRVPADLRLLEARDLAAEESMLTGESKPVAKSVSPVAEHAPTAARRCLCFSGTVITRGRGRGVVIATGGNTETGRIAAMLNTEKEESTPLQKRLHALGRYLVLGCLLICAAVAIFGFLAGGQLYTMILTGVSLAVASIPEGLPAIVTICLALGVWRLSRCRAIVRRLPAVETLGCTTCICSDKTGTLTENRMTVSALRYDGAWHGAEAWEHDPAAVAPARLIMANCHSLLLAAGEPQGDPTEVALYRAAVGERQREHKEELAFTAERRLMSVLVDAEHGTVSLVKGAPDVVLRRCTKIREQGGVMALTETRRQDALRAAESEGARGSRVLALALRDNAETREQMESELTLVALVSLTDPIRAEAAPALRQAREAGIRTLMITGDQGRTAAAVGTALELPQSAAPALTGAEIKELDEAALSRRLAETAVCARVDPGDKLTIVNALRRRGEIVAMTGDGVNDAPAIRAADIGVAMGQNGTDVAREAADLVLGDNSFATIVEAIRQGRGVYENIRKFIRYLLSSNIGEVLVMLAAVLLQLPLPLLPLQLLWINLVTDGLPALAVGMEKPSPTLMRQPPRPAGESIFARGLGKKILLRGVAIGGVTLLCFMLSLYMYGDLTVARTMAFCTLVLAQLFYAFDCRSEEGGLFRTGLGGNRPLLAATLLSFAMQAAVVYVPFLQGIFMTCSLTVAMWAAVMALSFAPTLIAGAMQWALSRSEKKYLSEQEFRF